MTTMDGNDQRKWYIGLKGVEAFLNTSYSKSTGRTPFEVLYGYNSKFHDGALREIAETEVNVAGTNPEQLQAEVRTRILDSPAKYKKRYLYKGKPNINSVEEAIYTRTAAGKYLVPELGLACTLYIKAHVKAEQVCRVIDCLMLSDGGNIDEVVDVLLKENPEQVLASDAFTDCHEQAVHYILDK
ncbi:hypothetical protein V5799_008721, partial [Amblyomma americanum]